MRSFSHATMLAIKLVVIGVLGLALWIPNSIVGFLVQERAERRDEVVCECGREVEHRDRGVRRDVVVRDRVVELGSSRALEGRRGELAVVEHEHGEPGMGVVVGGRRSGPRQRPR